MTLFFDFGECCGVAFALSNSTLYAYESGSGRLLKTVTDGDIVSETVHNGDGTISSFDAAGAETVETYDALGNLTQTVRKGAGGQADITSTSATTYGTGSITETATTTAGALSVVRSDTRDMVGRTVSSVDGQGGTTSYLYGSAPGGGRKETVTLPGGATRITEYYLDGQIKGVSGTAVTPEYHEYLAEAGGTVTETVYIGTADNTSPRWVKTKTDGLGRVLQVDRPGPNANVVSEVSFYNTLGQRHKVGRTGLAAQIFQYKSDGSLLRQGLDMDGNGVLDLGGIDRITENETVYEEDNGNWWEVQIVRSYQTDGNGAATEMSRTRRKLATGAESEQEQISATGQTFNSSTTIDRASKTVTTSATSNGSDLAATSMVVNGLLTSQSSLTVASAATFQYDDLGRRTHVADARTGQITETVYNALGQVAEIIEPGGGSTKYTYYPSGGANAGQLKGIENALGKKTSYAYDPQGRLTHQWGAAAYPIEYQYDVYGNRTVQRTFQAEAGWTGDTLPGAFATAQASVTTWVYDAATGLLLQKLDDANQGPTYQYNNNGLLSSRTWARGVAATYQYNPAGEITGVAYSDGTASVAHTYRRDGRRATTTDAAGTHSYEYANPGGAFSRESISGGMLDGLALTVLNGGVSGQRTSLSASRGGRVLQSVSYGYDPRSRLAGITSGDKAFAYTYAANSDLVESVTSSYQGNQVLGGSRVYDNHNRLDSLSYRVGANVVSLHDYQYDLLHRRTRANLVDAYYWSYGYNDRNEVISARKFAPDGSGLPGWGSGFAYDAIANRQWADRGGDSAGAGMRRTSYTPNSLNQYSGVANPGGFDVLGEAVAAATVTVNSAAAERKGGLFRKEITVDNSGGVVRQAVGITATLAGAGLNGADVVTQRNGNKVVRSANEILTHDLDGNLLGDDRWSYTWNGENRLAAVETSAAAVTAGVSKRKWAFDYDAQGRRVRKTAYSWDGTAWVLDQVRLCVYDGWNLIAELDGTSGDLVQRHTWGLDVGGTLQGAGGVGGLLSLEDFTGLPIPLYYTYDGNGNVMALVRATDGEVVARYDYSAFGELLRAEGEASELNPWRHATKYQDESGLLYYGYRYYSPETGRWLSRDPIGEDGGVNLYGFVGNGPVNRVDYLGLRTASTFFSKQRTHLKKYVSPKFLGLMEALNVLDAYGYLPIVSVSMFTSVPGGTPPGTTLGALYQSGPPERIEFVNPGNRLLAVVHETVHAYNYHTWGNWLNSRRDEGMAYVMESLFEVGGWFTQMEDILNSAVAAKKSKLSPQNTREVERLWRKAFDEKLTNIDIYYRPTRRSPLTKAIADTQDKYRVSSNFGGEGSCVEIAHELNKFYRKKGLCTRFSCDPNDEGENLIKTTKRFRWWEK